MKVYELLDSPEKWTKVAMARNAKGEYVQPDSRAAVQWCALGAVLKCYPHNTNTMIKVYSHLLTRFEQQSLTIWNDSPERTFEEVRKLFIDLDV